MDMGELHRQHQDIGLTTRALLAATEHPAQPEGTGRLRWQLARQLMTHLALEDRLLYPTLKRVSDRALREEFARLESEMGTLAKSFADYMARWNEDRVAREWPIFRIETQQILRILLERIAREDRLYRAAEADRTAVSDPLPRSA